MHPVLKRRSRLVLYLAVWIVFGLLLGMQSLAYWYLVQSMPPGETPIVRMVVSWVAAGLASLVAWLVLGYLWAQYLLEPGENYGDETYGILGLMIFAGAIGITLAVLGHYLAGAFERSRN